MRAAAERLLIAGLVAIVGLYLSAIVFVPYAADDFCDAVRVRDTGLLASVHTLYFEWTGRYSYAVVVSASKWLGQSLAGLPAAVTLLVWLAALYAITRRLIPNRSSALLALMLFSVTLGSAANTPQAFYWQSGLFNYGAALTLFCVLAWLIVTKRSAALCALLAFVTAGEGDLMAVEQVVILGMMALVYRKRQVIGAIVGASIGLLVVLIAPGNLVRQSTLKPYLISAPEALSYALQYGITPVSNALAISPLSLVLLAGVAYLTGEPEATLEPPSLRTTLLRLIGLIGAVMIVNVSAMFVAYFATASHLVPRARIIPLFFTLVCLIAVARMVKRLSVNRWLLIGVGALFIVVSMGRAAAIAEEVQAARVDIHPFGLEGVDSAWVAKCVGEYQNPWIFNWRSGPPQRFR